MLDSMLPENVANYVRDAAGNLNPHAMLDHTHQETNRWNDSGVAKVAQAQREAYPKSNVPVHDLGEKPEEQVHQ